MWVLRVFNLLLTVGLIGLFGKVATLGLPLAWLAVLLVPIGVAVSATMITLLFPPGDAVGDGRLWRTTPLGFKLNPAHPGVRVLLRVWLALGVVWLAAVDEALRHDLSHWLG